MMRSPTAAEKSVVDLLATWGATAQPGVTELLDALARSGKPEGLDLLRRALDTPGVALEPALREELSRFVDRASASPFDPALEAGLSKTLETVDRALKQSAGRRRESLRQEIRPWARLLSSEELERMWDLLWHSGTSADIPGRIEAVRGLEQAFGILDGARGRVEQELRASLESVGTSVDPEIPKLATRALESRDPALMAEARARLGSVTAGEDRKKTEEEAAAGRQRLSELCARVREAAQDPERGMDPVSKDLALSAVAASEGLLAQETSSSLPRSLGLWEQTLATMLDSATAAGAIGRDRRETLAQTLAKELAAAGERREIADRLRETVATGGRPFHEAVLSATGTLAELQRTSDAKVEQAAGKLRESVNKLASTLEKSAALLPTGHVVRSRLLLEQAEATAAGREPSAMDSLEEDISDEIERIREVAKLTGKHQRSREAARRKRIETEARSLLSVATGRDAKRLEAFIDELSGAKGGRALEAAADDLRTIAASVGNAVRLDCARTLRVADKKLKGKDATGPLGEKVERLRTAFEKDDLPAMAELSDEVHEEVKSPLSGPVARIALAVAAVLIVVGGFFAWQMLTDPSRTYELSLDTPEGAGDVTVTLVQDGQVVEGPNRVSGGSLSVSLMPGRYEVYVNGLFTGRVVLVPDDDTNVEGIPVPR
jgi:hypothetical protein